MDRELHLPKVEISKEVCISCTACDDACPTDVIRMGKDGYPFAMYEEDCQGCFICEWGLSRRGHQDPRRALVRGGSVGVPSARPPA